MPLATFHTVPALDSFTPIGDHQSQTPNTFYNAKPVLHYHAFNTKVLVNQRQASRLPIFIPVGALQSEAAEKDDGSAAVSADIFVASNNLSIFNHANSTGISIPYPTITLHAIQRLKDPSNPSQEIHGLYMQLELSDPEAMNEHEEEAEVLEITFIPLRTASIPSTESESGGPSSIQALFEAVSNCSNLNPDPTQDDDDMDDIDGDSRIIFEGSVGYEGISGLPGAQRGSMDGELPPPFPGSSGWITAENVGDYFDDEGNWIGGGEDQALGEGAGRVRGRDEVDEGGTGEKVNGHGDAEDDIKRIRTE